MLQSRNASMLEYCKLHLRLYFFIAYVQPSYNIGSKIFNQLPVTGSDIFNRTTAIHNECYISVTRRYYSKYTRLLTI